MDKDCLEFGSNIDVKTLYAANFSQGLDEVLYVMCRPFSDYALKARRVIQVNVCRADYHVSGVMLCRREITRNFREVMVIHYGYSSADFSSRTPPSFSGNVFSHQITDCLRAVVSVFGVIAALEL